MAVQEQACQVEGYSAEELRFVAVQEQAYQAEGYLTVAELELEEKQAEVAQETKVGMTSQAEAEGGAVRWGTDRLVATALHRLPFQVEEACKTQGGPLVQEADVGHLEQDLVEA